MAKIIVIGGGFAGLSAAAFLSNSGHTVILYEASPKLGGRAYSFKDTVTNDIIDNGQHILMGCYKYTLDFLNLIGAKKNLIFQKKLNVNFIHKEKGITPLKSELLPYPFNLLSAILTYKAISIIERLRILKLMLKLPFIDLNSLKELSIDEWLIGEGQTENCKKALWEILAVGTLNTNTHKASAYIFVLILKEIFFKGNFASTIIISKTGLSEMYCNDTQSFIEKNKGKIFLSHRVDEIIVDNGFIKEIIVNGKAINDFDFVITAVPSYSLNKMLRDDIAAKPELSYSSILTIHLWLKQNNLSELFYGLIDSPVHWVFNHKKYITIVISDADKYKEKSKDEILEIVLSELKTFLKISSEQITSSKIIKEKRATFIPSKDILFERPESQTKIHNLFLAGDWTNTGLPSTIESAVKSGKTVVNKINSIRFC